MSDAHEAIRNLLGIYCERMDAGDFDGLAALFNHARMTDEEGNVFATGTAEIAAMWHKQTILYDGSPRTRHITANPVITLSEGGTTARCRSSYIVFQDVPDVAPLRPIISGRYVDTFQSANSVWQWAERRYAVDHVVDLSHHLQ
ncbi:MAG: nuclear transport factor 2 family protein [Frankiaceae bacterium]|nr:nuclear transport factor 2 family protein [Frankiaceae bacterium]